MIRLKRRSSASAARRWRTTSGGQPRPSPVPPLESPTWHSTLMSTQHSLKALMAPNRRKPPAFRPHPRSEECCKPAPCDRPPPVPENRAVPGSSPGLAIAKSLQIARFLSVWSPVRHRGLGHEDRCRGLNGLDPNRIYAQQRGSARIRRRSWRQGKRSGIMVSYVRAATALRAHDRRGRWARHHRPPALRSGTI
jgi:hypothetical protein